MNKIIQTTIDVSGNVHLEFSGFVGHECQPEENRFREQLAALGLAINSRVTGKAARPLETGNSGTHQALVSRITCL